MEVIQSRKSCNNAVNYLETRRVFRLHPLDVSALKLAFSVIQIQIKKQVIQIGHAIMR